MFSMGIVIYFITGYLHVVLKLVEAADWCCVYIMQFEDKEVQRVSISDCYLCPLNYMLFPVHAVSSVALSAVSITRRFFYTRFPPLSLLHADSVTHRFHYPHI